MTHPKTMKIDDVEYVRADSVCKPHEVDGLRYAIVRSRDQGVMSGFVESINGRCVKLIQARQIWRYDSTFVLPDIAEHGFRNASNCKLSVPMSQEMVMLEACGVLYCTKKAALEIIGLAAVKK